MSFYSVRLPVAGSVTLEVEADSEDQAIQEAFEAFVIVDQIDEIYVYRSLDEHFVVTDTHTPFTKATVTKVEGRLKRILEEMKE